MPLTFKLDHPPSGCSVDFAQSGDRVRLQQAGLHSSEEGELFVQFLNGLSECYAPAFAPDGVPPSMVDHFLAIVRPDGRVTAYCNELGLLVQIRKKGRAIKAGERVGLNDVADVEELCLSDRTGKPVDIPTDCGFSLILSAGWRKMLYFDYSVFGPNAGPRTADLPRLFGRCYAHLLFQETLSAPDHVWTRLFEWGWFPFIGLAHGDRKLLLGLAQADRDPKPTLEQVCRRFGAELDARVASWQRADLFRYQLPFLTQASDRYAAQDYLSCISILFPRIEGIMRTLFVAGTSGAKVTQGAMVSKVVERRPDHSLLLPARFGEYLRRVYFRDFDQRSGDLPLSRHTVAHGVSNPTDYDVIRATLGFLLLDQLFYYLCD